MRVDAGGTKQNHLEMKSVQCFSTQKTGSSNHNAIGNESWKCVASRSLCSTLHVLSEWPMYTWKWPGFSWMFDVWSSAFLYQPWWEVQHTKKSMDQFFSQFGHVWTSWVREHVPYYIYIEGFPRVEVFLELMYVEFAQNGYTWQISSRCANWHRCTMQQCEFSYSLSHVEREVIVAGRPFKDCAFTRFLADSYVYTSGNVTPRGISSA